MDIKELIKLITKDNIISIMSDLGVSCTGCGSTPDGTSYLTFPTICHNGDSVDKLWWYENTKQFMCWTCCGNMSVFDLIMKVNHCTFKESFFYVCEKTGVDLHEQSRKGIQNPKAIKDITEEIRVMEQTLESIHNKTFSSIITKIYDKTVLERFDFNTFYLGWVEEGITIETMKRFNIGFYYLEGYIIIPHYDINGNLIGIRRRSLNPEDSKNKYMPITINKTVYNHALGLNFYGLFQNQENIKRKKTAIIVEGEKSVMLSDSYYGDDSIVLATCGFNISDYQIKILEQLGVNTVYLGFDKDFDITLENKYKQEKIKWENYIHYKDRLTVLGKRLSTNFNTYIIYDRHNYLQLKDSPLDRGKETFEKLLKEAKLVTN